MRLLRQRLQSHTWFNHLYKFDVSMATYIVVFYEMEPAPFEPPNVDRVASIYHVTYKPERTRYLVDPGLAVSQKFNLMVHDFRGGNQPYKTLPSSCVVTSPQGYVFTLSVEDNVRGAGFIVVTEPLVRREPS